MSVPEVPRAEQRWTIYKKLGKWDDVIQGPDTLLQGVEVVPAAVADRLAEALREIAAHEPTSVEGWKHWRQMAREALAEFEGTS